GFIANGNQAKEAKSKSLKVLALIRNSLHHNGIHRGDLAHFAIVGVDFDFAKGKKVPCAGWQHVAHAIGSVIVAINEILTSPEINGLPPPVRDEYAWVESGQ
ncbi:MAG: hypothetical protein IIA14_13655, partial [SAR324 cluster bacterium]|nr:hypothetical protein [SAR324 cluster bacterium]